MIITEWSLVLFLSVRCDLDFLLPPSFGEHQFTPVVVTFNAKCNWNVKRCKLSKYNRDTCSYCFCPKDPRDAVILKKGSTVDGLKSLHKGAVVRKTCKKLPLYDTCRSHLKL